MVVAIITSLLQAVSLALFSPALAFVISLVFLAAGMNLCVYLTKKAGIAVLFYLFTVIFTFWLDDLGVLGKYKILTFFFAGLIFELFFLTLKLKIHNLPVDMIMGTSLSTAGIPLITAFLISSSLASHFPIGLLNLMLLAFAAGLIASTITFLVWHHLEHTKLILRLEVYLMNLGK